MFVPSMKTQGRQTLQLAVHRSRGVYYRRTLFMHCTIRLAILAFNAMLPILCLWFGPFSRWGPQGSGIKGGRQKGGRRRVAMA